MKSRLPGLSKALSRGLVIFPLVWFMLQGFVGLFEKLSKLPSVGLDDLGWRLTFALHVVVLLGLWCLSVASLVTPPRLDSRTPVLIRLTPSLLPFILSVGLDVWWRGFQLVAGLGYVAGFLLWAAPVLWLRRRLSVSQAHERGANPE